MRVPSPQQIQYLNALDGQELTIQKLPNTTPHHVLSERFKKSYSFEKEASEIDAKIDIDEMELFKDIKNVSSKETIVSDGNDTDSSFDIIESEDKVKINFQNYV